MPKSREISLDLRHNIVDLQLQGEGQAAICKHFTLSKTLCIASSQNKKKPSLLKINLAVGEYAKFPKLCRDIFSKDVNKNPWTLLR